MKQFRLREKFELVPYEKGMEDVFVAMDEESRILFTQWTEPSQEQKERTEEKLLEKVGKKVNRWLPAIIDSFTNSHILIEKDSILLRDTKGKIIVYNKEKFEELFEEIK